MRTVGAPSHFIPTATELFRGCVLAIEYSSIAQDIGDESDLLRTGLEIQKYRLMSWAQRVGLFHDFGGSHTLDWECAYLILKQLWTFLTSADSVQNVFGLTVIEEDAAASAEEQLLGIQKNGVASIISRLMPDYNEAILRIAQEYESPIQRFRWVESTTENKDKLKAFLNGTSILIEELRCLLDSFERAREKEKYLRFLRDVVSLTTTTAEAGQIRELFEAGRHQRKDEQSIGAAAYVKQVRLYLGAAKREDEITPGMASGITGLVIPRPILLVNSLRPWDKGGFRASGREFAMYDGQQVLIQWKLVESAQWEGMKRLAYLLKSLSHDSSFQSLPYLGYYTPESAGRHFGILYSMPGAGTNWDFRSLQDLISSQPYAPLERRVKIMQALAETVLNLHTAGWVHKSIRPENVIFLAPQGSDGNVFLRSRPYVIGYEHGQLDTVESASTGLEANLYRHPQARGTDGEPFQRRFDMYALGCVLVELATWRPLVDVFASYAADGLKERIRSSRETNEAIELPSLEDLFGNEDAKNMLAHQAGQAVLEIIRTSYSVEQAKEGFEWALEDEADVVEMSAHPRL
ncbi:hypothetical protein B0H63DRAFT_483542 [Podospora didyma]|uniref:Protein kinase domain-containing protein n=1 Tax=Podospora didyma TaxID=330526 RepID=A0AAE0K8A8_9PEZI|nr:hypothetical protein B0H63DRAFT_483542 [Podospora didyma]